MPASRPHGRRRIEPRHRIVRREARSARRARRFALLVLLAAVFVVALALVAFGGQSTRPAPLATDPLRLAQSQPYPEIVALRGPVSLQLPVAQTHVTAIGFSTTSGALPLSPEGHQVNVGLLTRIGNAIFGGGGGNPRWYQLGGGGTNALYVGALAGTDVYAPVDGVVAAIRPFIVMGKQYGVEIDIQPQAAPSSLVVAVTQLSADPALTVGSAVVSGATQLGTVVNLARVEQQALAQYTNDGGNHVTIEVRAAPVVTAQ